MATSTPRERSADRNLLFGLLAWQMDFISQDALRTSVKAWVLDKDKPLCQVLVEQGALTASARDELRAVVELHLTRHGHDPQRSLAALRPIGLLRNELEHLAGPDLGASLAHVAGAGWVFRLKANLQEYTFFYLGLLASLFVLLFVPQINHLWSQVLPGEADWLLSALYAGFLVLLLLFYGLSLFLVMRQFPFRKVQIWVEQVVLNQTTRWAAVGPKKRRHPLYWIWTFVRLPDLVSRWLVWLVSRAVDPTTAAPAPSSSDTVAQSKGPGKAVVRFAVAASLLLLLGLTALGFGAAADGSRRYPLAGAFCQNMAVLTLLTGVWLGWRVLVWIRMGVRPLPSIAVCQGRILAWLFVTGLLGEGFWIAAGTQHLGEIMSYRLYTIWALIHVLSIVAITGLLIDRWDSEAVWPVRLVAVLLVLLGLYWGGPWTMRPTDCERYVTKETADKSPHNAAESITLAERDSEWFRHLKQRMDAIKQRNQGTDAGPYVIVAASGGGSRAAIFTALSLDLLARTPINSSKELVPVDWKGDLPRLAKDLPMQGSWADHILLISSVSGGSLATGYAVHRLGLPEATIESPTLRNTTKKELIWRLHKQAQAGIEDFRREQPQFRAPPGEQDPDRELVYWRKERDQLHEELNNRQEDELARTRALEPYRNFLALLWTEAYFRKLQQSNSDEETLRTALQQMTGEEQETRQRLERYLWVLRSRALDAMCTDFMAPVLRGILTPGLDRGESLARFWTECFGWQNSTNFSGYARRKSSTDSRYRPADQPLVLFNASDVSRGSRLVVGFPPLPHDLFWKTAYGEQLMTREPVRSLSELDPEYHMPLAHAIRLSANFPWGFRVIALQFADQPNASVRSPVHILDGGVVDNTGLDTVYELFQALAFYAKDNRVAREIMDDLRQRGVILLEIDSGAKPDEALAGGLLAGPREPIQALNNAAYTNSDQNKQLYVKETLQVLSGKPLRKMIMPAKFTAPESSEEKPVLTAFHYRIQCNHYQPGQAPKSPDVMTAWALGPEDKADVVGRFLIEVGLWDTRRMRFYEELQEIRDSGTASLEDTRSQALHLQESLDYGSKYSQERFESRPADAKPKPRR